MTPEDKYNRIHTFLDSLELGKFIILTGDNATGKSLIRRVLWSRVQSLKPDGRDRGKYIVDTSMERRTGSYEGLGALSGVFRDTPWTATSENSIHGMEQVVKITDRFLVFDEPEIGCSLELQAGMADYINKHKSEIIENSLGLLIITHSKIIVERLHEDIFFNMEGMTKDEWLNRKIKPLNIETFKKDAEKTFKFMQKVLKSAK